jgi:hypothetical protein
MDILLWIGRIALGLMFVAASGIVFLHTVVQVRKGMSMLANRAATAGAPEPAPERVSHLRVVKSASAPVEDAGDDEDIPLRWAA